MSRRALASARAPLAAAALALSVGILGPLPTLGEHLVFSVVQVDNGRFAMEPMISYAPNGSLWYLGARTYLHLPPEDANLWWAPNDATPLIRAPDPPTEGAGDAVLHHDPEGRMFIAELLPDPVADYFTEMGVRFNDTVWKVQTLPRPLNRPMIATTANGETFVAGKDVDTHNVGMYQFNRHSPTPGEPLWFHGTLLYGVASGLADMVGQGDTLHVLVRNATSSGFFVASSIHPPKQDWTFTTNFSIDRWNGIPKLVFADDGTMYVVSSERVDGIWSAYLRRWDHGTWAGPFRLCAESVTCTVIGAAAGNAGRIGVAWYETDGHLVPPDAPKSTIWRFRYGLFDNATTTPALVESQTLLAAAHQGPAGSKSFGDYVTVLPRQGDPEGKVAIAFMCSRVCGLEVNPLPYFGLQTAGPGLRT